MQYCLDKQSKAMCDPLCTWLNETVPGTVPDLSTIILPDVARS